MTDTPESSVPGRSSLLASLDAALDGARPDFEEVLGRVEAGEGDGALEEHVDLGEPPQELAEACEALRTRLEARLDARLAHPSVPPSVFDDAAPRRGGVWAVLGVMVAAALLLLVLDLPSLFRSGELEDDVGSDLAVDEARPEDESGQARFEEPPRTKPKAAAPRRWAVPPPEPEPLLEPEPLPAPVPEPALSLSDRLAALDTRAQKKWAAGELDGARRDFRKIVKLGGKRKRVELAYAELFALARQQGEDLAGLWREYLRKFPKGRYAREASAGLCRTAAASERERCWHAHRERFGDAPGGGTG